MTMNIGAFSLGTETMGSIVSPASHQSVVGFKPTHSSVSGEGVLPLAPSLDTVGRLPEVSLMLRKAIMRLRKTRFRALIQRNLLKITYKVNALGC